MSQTIRLHRVLRATPDRIYRAFIDPAAMVKWLPPFGFTGEVHSQDARVGGRYQMSFTNFSTGSTHSFGGEYLELEPGKRLVNTDRFDDPGLAGEMTNTVELSEGPMGTELSMTQARIPDMIPAPACVLCCPESLTILRRLVEAELRARL